MRLDEQAIQAFTTYITGSPTDARAYLYLGNACLRLGRKEEARVAYGSFLERAEPGPEVSQIQRILETIGRDAGGPGAGKAP